MAADDSSHPAHYVINLARALGNVTVLQKGAIDLISNGIGLVACGAQGTSF